MPSTQTSKRRWSRKAFTLVESLLTLFVCSFLTLVVTGPVTSALTALEEALFFLSFEGLYADSQILAARGHQEVKLSLSSQGISNGYQTLEVPDSVQVPHQEIVFDRAGGNSSLAKISFETADGRVSYQLYLGSGRYKKTKE